MYPFSLYQLSVLGGTASLSACLCISLTCHRQEMKHPGCVQAALPATKATKHSRSKLQMWGLQETVPAARGLPLQLNFQHVINLPFAAGVEICLFVTSVLNTSNSKYLLPFVTSQLLTKPAPGYACSQPDTHTALPALTCQSPAFSLLTVLLKYTTSQFAIKYFSKLTTHFVPFLSQHSFCALSSQ